MRCAARIESRRAFGLIGALLGVALGGSGGCGSEEAPSAEARAPSGAARFANRVALEAGELSISLSSSPPGVVRFNAADGAVERLGLPLLTQLVLAYDVTPRDIELTVPLAEGRFDVRARPLDGTRATAEAMMREGLAAHFGLQVRVEQRREAVFALRRSDVGLDLAASGETVVRGTRVAGNYRVNGAPISDLVRFLDPWTELPIVDETGLDGRYDLVLEWDTASGARALEVALADSGLRLDAVEAERTRIVVEAAR